MRETMPVARGRSATRRACVASVVLAIAAMTPTGAAAVQDRFWEAAFSNAPATRMQPRIPRQTVSISPRYGAGNIVVSFADRRLYFITRPGEAISYPIGVPTGAAAWSGSERVTAKRVDPPWTPTENMRRENPELPAHVPGGHPQNPMGVRALYLGSTLYRIHGTDAPWSIGQEVSRGCIRLYNDDVIDLYDRVRIGAQVVVTHQRVATR